MQTVFLFCAGIGALVLVVQIVLTMVGFDGDTPDLDLADVGGAGGIDGGSGMDAGLDLLSVRSLAAAVAVFGASGLWLDGFMPSWLAAAVAAVPAFAAAVLTSWLTRLMLKAESSGTLVLDGAVGATGTVYLPVPAAEGGTGIVQVMLQGRTVELRATTREKEPLTSGESVFVVSVDAAREILEVVPTRTVEEIE